MIKNVPALNRKKKKRRDLDHIRNKIKLTEPSYSRQVGKHISNGFVSFP